MQPIFPILVPSIARAKTSRLLPLLRDSGLPFWFITEPQDYKSYLQVLPPDSVLQMPENDCGLPLSVRQWTLDYARSQNIKWYWMIDDDVSGFYRTIKAPNVAIDIAEALSTAQLLFADNAVIGQAGLEYKQFSLSASKLYALNSYCDGCVAINTSIPKDIRFDRQTNLKVDRDFTLQVLAAGFNTIRTSQIAFSTSK